MNYSHSTIPAAEWLEQALADLRRERHRLHVADYEAAVAVLSGIEMDDLLVPEVCVIHEDGLPRPRFVWRGPTGKVLLIQPYSCADRPCARITVYDAAGVYASFEGREFLNVIRGWLAIVFPDGRRVSEPEPGTWTGPVRGERTR